MQQSVTERDPCSVMSMNSFWVLRVLGELLFMQRPGFKKVRCSVISVDLHGYLSPYGANIRTSCMILLAINITDNLFAQWQTPYNLSIFSWSPWPVSLLDSSRDRGGDVLRDVRFRRRRLRASVALAFGLMCVIIGAGNTFQLLPWGVRHSPVRWELSTSAVSVGPDCRIAHLSHLHVAEEQIL